MGIQNSRIEILLGVIRNLLDDIATLVETSCLRGCKVYDNPRREGDRDYQYIASRVRSEGLPFLTHTLPRLGKWYDQVISNQIGVTCCEGFAPFTSITISDHVLTCPIFARTLAYVLSDEHGHLQARASIIRAYRSLFYLFYKLEVPFTEQDLVLAQAKWLDTEADVADYVGDDYFSEDNIKLRQIVETLIWPRDEEWVRNPPLVRHGPGAVAGGEDNQEKWLTFHRIPSLHSVYPRYDYIAGWRDSGRISPYMCMEIKALIERSETREAVSRLLFVPKDSRGPRTIACEPKELMFLQQGVARGLMPLLTSRSHGRINFVDQTINANLALLSSEDGGFATVDLQDASDRVSLKLVQEIFPEWMLRYLNALRSTKTLLPDNRVMTHTKYAPMGSALCFPVESVVFWAISVLAGLKSGLTLESAMADTYVYGDDIIIRPHVFPALCRELEKRKLRVNVSKSYVSGPFRESCGIDAWKGKLITPLKLKKDVSRSLDGSLALATLDIASECFARDYRKTGDYLVSLVESKGYRVLRYPKRLAGLTVVDEWAASPESQGFVVRLNKGLCRVYVRGWVVQQPKKPCYLDGLSRLNRAYYGNWQEHDPSQVPVDRAGKILKRNILLE